MSAAEATEQCLHNDSSCGSTNGYVAPVLVLYQPCGALFFVVIPKPATADGFGGGDPALIVASVRSCDNGGASIQEYVLHWVWG